jgi:hypothetical protein
MDITNYKKFSFNSQQNIMVLLLLFRSVTPLFRDQTFGRLLGAYNNTFVWHKLQLKLSLSVLTESVLVYVCFYAPSHRCVAHITITVSGRLSAWLF